jgi:hypothetical protein
MSVSIYVGYREGEQPEIKLVVPSNVMFSHFYPNGKEVANPNYNPIFDVNWCNTNAHMVMGALGISIVDGCFEVPAKRLVSLTTNWLRSHAGHPVAGRKTVVYGNVTSLGVSDGYLNDQIHRLFLLTREAVKCGANIIYGA